MNIKNEHVHELAREAARRTGLSQTSALEKALEEFLARLPDAESLRDRERSERRAGIDEVLAEMDRLLTDEVRDRMQATIDDLYDERGLPR